MLLHSLFLSPLVGIPWSIDIRHSSFTSDISRPDEPADQPLSGALRARVVAYGVGYPDATAEERRFGRGIWWRGHGEYFRSTNH